LPAELRIGTFLAPRLKGLYAAVAEAVGGVLVQGRDFHELLDGTLDAAFLCGLPYVRLGEGVEALAAPVPSGDRYGGRAVYFSDVIVRTGDPARSLADLTGRRFAFNEEGSHSGHNVVAAAMDFEAFESATAVGSHAAAIEAVRAGEADGAAVDSHLLDLLRGDDPALDAELRIAESLGPSPEKPLAAGPALGAGERKAIREALAALPVDPAFRVDRWAPVDDSAYEPIREMLLRAARPHARSSGG
jgi:ABC-type phosphate/phosphonate transport system substrate-binding protein